MKDKRAEISTCMDAVMHILKTDPESRSNYGRLIAKVDEYFNPNVRYMKHAYVLENRASLHLPQYETITRSRRLLQANHPELRAGKKVQEACKENEAIFEDLARAKV